jgi:hypothetical protein
MVAHLSQRSIMKDDTNGLDLAFCGVWMTNLRGVFFDESSSLVCSVGDNLIQPCWMDPIKVRALIEIGEDGKK